MTTTTRTRWDQLAAEVAAAVDAGTLDRESALYREFLQAARERARGRDDDAAEHTTD
jgi:hypothetical protein